VDAHDGLFVVGYGEVDALGRIHGSGDVGKHLLQAALDLIHVDITDNDDALEVGTIPFLIVGAQELMIEIGHNFLGADDGHGDAVRAVGIDLRQNLVVDTRLGVQSLTHLLQDDATLVLDFIVFKGDEARPVVQHEEAGVYQTRVGGGDVVEHINGLLEARPSIHVGAEFHTVALHVVKHGFLGEVLQAVEGHVLQEVGETALVLFFEDGTNLLRDVEVGALGGFFIVTDVISQSVLQLTSSDVWVEGDLLGNHGDAQGNHCK